MVELNEKGYDPKLVSALRRLVEKLEAMPEPLRGPFLVKGLKPYLPLPAPDDGLVEGGEMSPEEIRLENLKQMAAYDGPIVSFEAQEPYYLASCNRCGWVGSSERCGTDSFGDDSDVYCPRCFASGADCGKVAESLSALQSKDERIERLTREKCEYAEALKQARYRYADAVLAARSAIETQEGGK